MQQDFTKRAPKPSKSTASSKRYQHGHLSQTGDRWTLRYREDVVLETGEIQRRLRNRTIGLVADLPTKRAARNAAQELLRTLNASTSRSGAVMTFAAFSERWKASALPSYKLTTRRVAAGHLALYLLPRFGAMQLEQINTEGVQGLVAALRGQLRRSSIVNVISTLCGILAAAKKWGYLVGLVERDGLALPRDTSPPRRPHWTAEQVHQILDAAAEPWRTLFMLFAATGLRGAEALALSVQDVDFKEARIFVRRTAQLGVLQLPKSTKSTRVLPMPPALAQALQAHIASAHFRDSPEGLIFTSESRTPLRLDSVRERRLWPVLDALGLDRCGFHAFRRTSGTAFSSTGASIKVAQQQLGHADARVTLEIYQQLVPADQRAGAEKVADLLIGKAK